MKIYATFANRTYDPEALELVHAWDEWSVDENPRGYEDTKAEALASWGSELLRSVTVELKVPLKPIEEALNPQPRLTAQIVTSTPAAHEGERGEG